MSTTPTTAPADSPASPRGAVGRTRTTLAARGEPMVWITGMALVVCLTMISLLIGVIVLEGARTFWPRPIEQISLKTGERFLGMPVRDEQAPDGTRRLYQTGNRDVTDRPFRWVDLDDIQAIDRPEDAVLLERDDWGVWIGFVESVGDDGGDVEDLLAALPAAGERRERIERMKQHELGGINSQLERTRMEVLEARVEQARMGQDRGGKLKPIPWASVLVLTLAACVGWLWSFRRQVPSATASSVRGGLRTTGLGCLAALGVLALVATHPWRGEPVPVTEVEQRAQQQRERLTEEYAATLANVRALEAADAKHRVRVVDPSNGRFAPERKSEPDAPLRLSQIHRAVQANSLGWTDKLGVFVSRWGEYLTSPPRDANTAGGVQPVIMGTVLVTLLLTVAVLPMGVIAALYMREYARQGWVISVVRIAVNNLAGVPSIVYGVFGLGFFCYTLGSYVDSGPAQAAPVARWWLGVVLAFLVFFLAIACGALGRTRPGMEDRPTRRVLRWGAVACWIGLLGLLAWTLSTTPYFNGFFEAKASENTPTFGKQGLLWASLTLALLTLPVVIVSTEEAIAAVPNSMREGSYGCGASKWQTIRQIVLPGAMPGIMTGAVLAMARGAGEVAPLMLVGAVKLNPELPLRGEFPYLHLEQSIMHLGFHIYDLGFQSPDSQAARPMVWTTTLLLLMIVLALNLCAILVRARLRARMVVSAV